MHPSLLPRHRGAAPIQHTLLRGDRVTGVSVIKIAPGEATDAGDVLWQANVGVGEDTMHRELEDELARLGAKAVTEVLKGLPGSWDRASRQDHDKATKAPRITNQGRVRFAEHTNEQVYDAWRALQSNGGIHAEFVREGEDTPRRARLRNVFLPRHTDESTQMELASLPSLPPGTLYMSTVRPSLWVACAYGWVGLGELAVAGLPPMDASRATACLGLAPGAVASPCDADSFVI
eukprot:NODE_910_length_1382_cov_5.132783_g758_i0.p1 GENE.NODE_910_length_1382_cov_5.132783_g758_i0~~NODE_910_length_1382_cov_5.132783_g758_i0.p1  ORF type:complete len:234 (-),score=47.35 NODE_910_length_1382_cov_5.132783_g758_i0:10-711(-)